MHFSFSWRRYLEDDDDIGSLVDPEACFQSDQGGDISISPVPVAKTRITPSNTNGDTGSCYDKHMSESPHVLVKRDVDSDDGNNADGQYSISSLSDLAATLNDAMRQGNDPAQCQAIDLREMSGSDVVFVIDENTLNEYLNTKGQPLHEGPLSLDGDSVTFLPLVSDEESDVDTNTERNVKSSTQFDEGSETAGIAESATSESKEGIKDSETEAGSKETVGTTEAESTCTKQTRETMEATSITKETRQNTHPVSGAKETIRSEQRTSGAQEVKKATQVKFDAKEITLTDTSDKTARVITKSVFSANEAGGHTPAVSEIKVISLPNKSARIQLREAITKKLNQNEHREATGDGKELLGCTTRTIASSADVLEKGDQVSGCIIHYENEILTSGKGSGTTGKVRQTNSLSRVDRSSEKLCSVGVDKNRVSSPCKRQRSATCLIENECTRRKL